MIISVLGVPGCLLAGWAVELPKVGRRGTLAIFSGKRMYLFSSWFHYSTTLHKLWILVSSFDSCLLVWDHNREEQRRVAGMELWLCIFQQRERSHVLVNG